MRGAKGFAAAGHAWFARDAAPGAPTPPTGAFFGLLALLDDPDGFRSVVGPALCTPPRPITGFLDAGLALLCVAPPPLERWVFTVSDPSAPS